MHVRNILLFMALVFILAVSGCTQQAGSNNAAGGVTTTQTSGQATSMIKTLMQNPAAYLGQRVTIEGYALKYPDGGNEVVYTYIDSHENKFWKVLGAEDEKINGVRVFFPAHPNNLSWYYKYHKKFRITGVVQSIDTCICEFNYMSQGWKQLDPDSLPWFVEYCDERFISQSSDTQQNRCRPDSEGKFYFLNATEPMLMLLGT